MSRRRQYPTQQYSFDAAPPAAAPVYPAAPAYSGGEVFTPGATPGVNPAASVPNPASITPQMSQMRFDSVVEDTVQLNQVQTEDVLQALPPPVDDLDLPPPPLVIPPSAACTGSEWAQASTDYMRSTLNCIPTSHNILKKSKLPLAIILRPSAALEDENENIPLVNDMVIARCRRCRSYINPFVEFRVQDQRWRCNVCSLTNEVPQKFDWDALQGRAVNRFDRNELNYGVVDFIAGQEYLVRAPPPPVFVFVIDVSVQATSVGLLERTATVLRESLDRLPNEDGRTRVAFLAVDGALNYFQIPLPKPEAELQEGQEIEEEEPRQLVVSELNEPFLPCPSGLLVNLKECRPGIDKLLDQLPTLFAPTVQSSCALGSALKAALNMIANIGGKIVCISASLPNVGIAKLEPREDRKVFGTSKETQLFSPASSFYRSFAVDCNRSQVTVDMFLLSSTYQDVASLSNLPKFTGGATYFYPGWTARRESDATKFGQELTAHLSQDFGMESVIRLRASSGIRASSFYGNFFIRSSDLMSFPTFPRDQAYAIELSLDDNITRPWVVIQAALLYTTVKGDRRVRVLTMSIPTSSSVQDVYASADQQAIVTYYARVAAERTIHSGLTAAQDFLTQKVVDVFRAYAGDAIKTHSGSGGSLQLCTNMRLFPLLIHALKRTVGLRRNAAIASDLRMHALTLLQTMPTPALMKYLYPDFYALHELPEEAGLPDPETGAIILPPRLNLTGEQMRGHGLYLIDDGQVMFLWVGRDTVPQLLLDAFGVADQADVPSGKSEMPVVDSDLNRRIQNLIAQSRIHADAVTWPSLFIVKQTSEPTLRLWATTMLVEDRSESEPTYYQFLASISEKLTT